MGVDASCQHDCGTHPVCLNEDVGLLNLQDHNGPQDQNGPERDLLEAAAAFNAHHPSHKFDC